MIKRIRIQNFRSLVDVTVDLDELTVLIGRSGTGKSNFVRAIRFLRDSLNSRSFGGLAQNSVLHPTHQKSYLRYEITLTIEGLSADLKYELSIHPNGQVGEESLRSGDQTLFHHHERKWAVAPKIIPEPKPEGMLLGAIRGLQESTIAYVAIRSGVGCYEFSGDVLQGDGKKNDPADRGFGDRGDNYLAAAERIVNNIAELTHWKRISRAVRAVNPTVDGLTLDMPGAERIDANLRFDNGVLPVKIQESTEWHGSLLPMDVRQESEGFRRFLAHLLALYQTPSKQTLLFEHPESGLHPGALEALFEEFVACPQDRRGQVILTTHSPQLLDYFEPQAIRVVDIENQKTRIDRLAPEQFDALKDALLRPGELLTVDPARLPDQLDRVPG